MNNKRLVMLAASILLTFHAGAQLSAIPGIRQEITVGVKAGVNFWEINGQEWKNTYKPGYLAGAFVAFTRRKIGVQAEAMFSAVKMDYNNAYFISGVGFSRPSYVSMTYLDIPVLVEYRIVPRLWLQAGPQVGELLSAKNNEHYDVKRGFNNPDMGAVLGLQAILPAHFTASARYVLGLTGFASVQDGNTTWNSHSMQLAIGYRFL